MILRLMTDDDDFSECSLEVHELGTSVAHIWYEDRTALARVDSSEQFNSMLFTGDRLVPLGSVDAVDGYD